MDKENDVRVAADKIINDATSAVNADKAFEYLASIMEEIKDQDFTFNHKPITVESEEAYLNERKRKISNYNSNFLEDQAYKSLKNRYLRMLLELPEENYRLREFAEETLYNEFHIDEYSIETEIANMQAEKEKPKKIK